MLTPLQQQLLVYVVSGLPLADILARTGLAQEVARRELRAALLALRDMREASRP